MNLSLSKAIFTFSILGFFIVGALFYLNNEVLKDSETFEVQGNQLSSDDQEGVVAQEILDTINEIEKEPDWGEKILLFKSLIEKGEDPKASQKLKAFDLEEKAELQDFYRSLKWEDRNARGMAVQLYGQNISDENDINFMIEVLTEPLCLSLENCEQPYEASAQDKDSDLDLLYPQIMVLESLQSAYKFQKNSKMKNMFIATATIGLESPSPYLQKLASQVLKTFDASK